MGRHHGKHDRPALLPTTELIGIESRFFTAAAEATPVIIVVNPSPNPSNIWDVIRDQWSIFTSDASAAADRIHDEYLGWFISDSTPDDKNTLVLWIADSIANRTTSLVRISPVGAKVVGDVATVHYHYLWIYSTADSTRHQEIGYYTETLVNDSGKWMLLNDVGGPTG